MGKAESQGAANYYSKGTGGEKSMETLNVTIWKVTPETNHNAPVLIVTEADDWSDAVTLAEQTVDFEFRAIERHQYAHFAGEQKLFASPLAEQLPIENDQASASNKK